MISRLRFNRKYFAFPYIFVCVLFVVIPIIILLAISLRDTSGNFTLSNYSAFVSQGGVRSAIIRSIGMATLTTLICLVIAYPVALILSNSRFNKSPILVLLFILPMWVNFLLRTFALGNILDMLHIPNGYFAVLLGMIYDFFPFMLLPLYTILNSMDKSLIEASNDLGAKPIGTFLKVTLPLSVPGIVSGVLMVFMPTISTFAINDMLGNPYTYMFGNIINDYFQFGDTWNIGAAFAFIMLIIIAISILIASKLASAKNTSRGTIL